MDTVVNTADTSLIESGEMEVLGQLAVASNATLLVEVNGVRAVYKPVAGEQPLWDFPDHTLGLRELAAYQFSEALHWSIVPPTVFRDGPYGPGAVQLWIDIDEEIDLIDLVNSDHPRLAQIALFDAMINNTDRKVSHLLPTKESIFGCDHGVTFHEQDKLRTVLWQWRGLPIPQDLLDDIKGVAFPELPISEAEMSALKRRMALLIEAEVFPMPSSNWPAVPYPPF